jgi:hypothetical protein
MPIISREEFDKRFIEKYGRPTHEMIRKAAFNQIAEGRRVLAKLGVCDQITVLPQDVYVRPVVDVIWDFYYESTVAIEDKFQLSIEIIKDFFNFI